MRKNYRYVGTTEQRINKFMRMCLHWQFNIQRGIEKKSSYYFTKYHVDKYPKRFFSDLSVNVIDRAYAINKMNLISEYRMLRDRKLGLKSNKVVLRQIDFPSNQLGFTSIGVKISDDTILKNVAKSKYNLSEVSTLNLVEELQRRTIAEA